ncbi:MAG: tyrosine-type recombinase/integrase [Thermoanaerobaculia bacterium]
MARSPGRPKGRDPNHHLTLSKEGTWTFRWCRAGRDVNRTTGCPKREVVTARAVRDKLLAEFNAKRFGVGDEIPSPKPLGEIVQLYLNAQSRPYDRGKGGKQKGHKRSWKGDRSIVRQLKKRLDFALAADRIDKERLLGAAAAWADQGLASNTIRNRFRFLHKVYRWGRANRRETGITVNPFDEFDGGDESKELFGGGVEKKAPPYTREQLRALYELLPAHVAVPARFAAHTGMRVPSELLNMTWGRLDVEGRTYTTDPRWTKGKNGGKERAVPLGDVALEILKRLRPADPGPNDPVWLNGRRDPKPLRDVSSVIERRMKKVCPEEPRPGWRRPDRHSLRRSCGTALERAGAPRAVIEMVLGHASGDTTSRYIGMTTEDCVVWLNRAAALIDGAPQENVVPMVKTGLRTGTAVLVERAG